MTLHLMLNVDSNGFSRNAFRGTAHTSRWPDAPVVNGVIDGDQVRFTVIMYSVWQNWSPTTYASGLPRLDFTGTVRGNVMEIKLRWDSVMIDGAPPPPKEYTMRAERAH